MFRTTILTWFALSWVPVMVWSCASQLPVVVKDEAPRATLRIQVAESTLAIADDERVVSSLRKGILNSRTALPVAEDADADLELKIELSGVGRFSEARWSLYDLRSGVVVLENNTSFVINFDPESAVVEQIMDDLGGIDLNTYASRDAPIAAVPAPAQPPAPAATGNPSSRTEGRNAWAVVIGIDTYREGLPPARHAEKDAQAFETYLRETLGVPPEQIKLLLGSRASRGDMASALEEWLPRNAGATPKGPVYLFFSGHGAPDPETGDAYLVPWDADPAYLKTRGYPLTTLYTTLEKLPNAQVMVFLDACFSGSGDRSVIADGTRPLVPVHMDKPKRDVATFAAAEAAQTTGAAPKAEHGLFTYHLLAGLRGAADIDRDRNITLDELARYVTPQVQRDARLANREQTPTLSTANGANITLVQGLDTP
ncbi:MAG: caspase family protein [Myxococcota bacterium]